MLRIFKEIQVEGDKLRLEISNGLLKEFSILASRFRREIIDAGNVDEYIRENGSRKQAESIEVKALIELPRKDIINTNLECIYEQLAKAIYEMAQQMDDHAFRMLDEATTEVSNVLYTHGEKLSLKDLVQMIEMTEASFENGKWEPVLIVRAPHTVEANFDIRDIATITVVVPPIVMQQIGKWLKTPEIIESLYEIIDEKRRDYLAKRDN